MQSKRLICSQIPVLGCAQATHQNPIACILCPMKTDTLSGLSLLSVCSARPVSCFHWSLDWGTQHVCLHRQASGFLWSCHPGLVREQLSRSLSFSQPRQRTGPRQMSSVCSSPVEPAIPCSKACSFYWGSVSGHVVRFQSYTGIKTHVCVHIRLNSITWTRSLKLQSCYLILLKTQHSVN